ncbi:hypothetical protein CIRG_02226 [Coccidioides immitis RMSCC 2394]|uniref:Uncharacterized protein n=1 Tax=Coccidioides immitis RMSCC 2394 TaxID=404692 RepID=A0A0J7AXH1_COCIT|nr:hypothetical protein CIRG_02226 [Coccidioides immitis RMSCC 2394]
MSRIRAPTVSAETLQLGLRPIKAQESSTLRTGAIIAQATRLMSSNAKSRVGYSVGKKSRGGEDHLELLLKTGKCLATETACHGVEKFECGEFLGDPWVQLFWSLSQAPFFLTLYGARSTK